MSYINFLYTFLISTLYMHSLYSFPIFIPYILYMLTLNAFPIYIHFILFTIAIYCMHSLYAFTV